MDITASAALANVNQAIAFICLWLDSGKPDNPDPFEADRLAGIYSLLSFAQHNLEEITGK